MKTPDITVVIPTYNREKELLDTIQAILDQSHANLELLVIDQTKKHPSETGQALNNISDKRFKYFQVDPPSLPAARNFGLRKARAPIALFIDDDIKPSRDLVKYHVEAYQIHPEVNAVGGRVNQAGFPVQKKVLSFDKYGVSRGVFTATDPGYTNAFPGGNCSLRVKDALKVGGFDTRYRGNAFREESDMAIKMAKAGMKIYYEPQAELLHLETPYGGLRVKTDRFDSLTTYKNELFFTARVAGWRYYLGALRLKFREYCNDPGWSKKFRIRRSFLFLIGLLASWWNLLLGRQIIARERRG